ncbi:hypothetical protein ASE85_10500 [Sphingobium sp. Leaf26]|nr:hypothetical protein ASE85_10500 [Sphingobium sp. Leaf26]
MQSRSGFQLERAFGHGRIDDRLVAEAGAQGAATALAALVICFDVDLVGIMIVDLELSILDLIFEDRPALDPAFLRLGIPSFPKKIV